MAADQVKALIYDVFGTVVDWRSSIIREGKALGEAKGVQVDWSQFADEWRKDGYVGAIQKIHRGELPFTTCDALMRTQLDLMLPKYGIEGLSEAEIDHFSKAWHRLTPWPDSVPGLTRLKKKFVNSPLSNGNFALLTNMGKFGGLPWDCIISADVVGAFKPNPKAYLGACTLLGLEPDQVMLVAAHVNDLRSAQKSGLHAAYVPRPREWGPNAAPADPTDPAFDYTATDFVNLAEQLGT